MLVAISLFLSSHYLSEQERLAAAGDLKGALHNTILAERFDPFSSEPAQARALLLQRQGHNKESEIALEEAIQKDPHNYIPYLQLGNLQLFTLNDLRAAEQSYRDVLRLDPHATIARLALAEALIRAGKLEEAAKEYETLKESGNITPQGLYDLGRIYVRTGDPAKGVKTIRSAQRKLEASLKETNGAGKAQTRALIRSMDLAIADGLVVQRRYGAARHIVANSKARQAPAILELLNTNPEGYRRSVKNSAIY